MDFILREILPNALAIGVPYETFWVLSPEELEPFKKAFLLSQEFIDINNWQLGNYIRYAVGSALDSKVKYPEEPFIHSKAKEERLTEEEKIARGKLNNELVYQLLMDKIRKREQKLAGGE